MDYGKARWSLLRLDPRQAVWDRGIILFLKNKFVLCTLNPKLNLIPFPAQPLNSPAIEVEYDPQLKDPCSGATQ